jgi:hypothetical protein
MKGEKMTENANEILNEQEDAALAAKIAHLQSERTLMIRLTEAGVKDMEAALLVGMSRMAQADTPDIDAVIAAMKKDKAHLFADVHDRNEGNPPVRTGGARRKGYDGAAALEKAAKRAATSGSRTDLQQYLRLRRNSR